MTSHWQWHFSRSRTLVSLCVDDVTCFVICADAFKQVTEIELAEVKTTWQPQTHEWKCIRLWWLLYDRIYVILCDHRLKKISRFKTIKPASCICNAVLWRFCSTTVKGTTCEKHEREGGRARIDSALRSRDPRVVTITKHGTVYYVCQYTRHDEFGDSRAKWVSSPRLR